MGSRKALILSIELSYPPAGPQAREETSGRMRPPQPFGGAVTTRPWARTLSFLSILTVVVTLPRGLAQTPPPQNTSPQAPATGNASPQSPAAGNATGPVGLLGRKGPRQPQLKQTLEYFVGTWSETWRVR